MNKRKIHHYLVKIRVVPPWGLFIATILCLIVAVFALRANNQKMIELRDAVFVADEQNGDIEGALKALREHIYAHMNTSLTANENAIRPPIQLKYTYERLLAKEEAKLKADNSDLYADAQRYCEKKFPTGFSGSNRLPCIREYLDSHGGASIEEDIFVPEDVYKFDFASPTWSPDLAGWSLVAAALFFVLFLLRMGTELILKHEL